MKGKIRKYLDGRPLSEDLNRIIDAIESTPMENFWSSSSNINLAEMSEKEKIQYFKKHPQSIFSYSSSEYGLPTSLFTNFRFVNYRRPTTLSYDIIRIEEDSLSDLTKIQKIDWHNGIRVRDIQEERWQHIVFLTPLVGLLNWKSIPWEDLK